MFIAILLFQICGILNQCVFNIGICMDSSRSVGSDGFETEKEIIKSYYTKLVKETQNFLPIAVVSFGRENIVHFTYKEYDNEADVIDAIDKIEYKDMTQTNIGPCMDVLYKMEKPIKDYKNVMFVLTDGKESSEANPDITEMGQTLISNDYIVFAAGVKYVDQRSLLQIVGNYSDRYICSGTYEELITIIDIIGENICEEVFSVICYVQPTVGENTVIKDCEYKNVGEICHIECINEAHKVGEDAICKDDGTWSDIPECVIKKEFYMSTPFFILIGILSAILLLAIIGGILFLIYRKKHKPIKNIENIMSEINDTSEANIYDPQITVIQED